LKTNLATDSSLRIVSDTMPAAAMRCSRDLRYLWVNPQYARWLGQRADEIVGRHILEVLGVEVMRQIQPLIDQVLQGETAHFERLAEFKGLGRRWISGVYAPTYGATREPDGWVTTLVDIHDRKRAEEAVREADRRKDEFLGALAHELRNPLAPIRNAVAILGRKGSQDPEVAWSQGVIERQIDQLSRLIDDLVDIERISRGKFQLRKEPVPLEVVVDMALETSRPQINAAGHHLSVLLPSERVALEVDPARLAQVLGTLLKNAAKHIDGRGTISLGASVEGREVAISVEDNGVGFDPLAAAQLFNPGRGTLGTAPDPEGHLGVGLTLAQGIVALHRGSIRARSAGPNKGSEFEVRLPLASLAGIADKPAPYTAISAGLKVMVADDNRDAADSLQRILSIFGHEVRVVYDGAAAVKLGDEFKPRVAILDIGMPGTNGYEVARALRRSLGQRVTLVALTGWGQDADRRRAVEAGFDHHLTKPVDPGALNNLLAEAASK
jgi:PAS domain S-box-containing protein